MSGSIGGSRIKKEEICKTFSSYKRYILEKYPIFKDVAITGSYNTGNKADYGDIDVVVLFEQGDLKKQKKDFQCYLDALENFLTRPFIKGKNINKKSQLYGAIVTCGFPITDREDDYVQIDNIITNTSESWIFQKNFLDIEASKQALLMGISRIMFNYIDRDMIETLIKKKLSPIGEDEEYEFSLSQKGLTLKRVLYAEDKKEISCNIEYKTENWDLVCQLFSEFGISLKETYKDMLLYLQNLLSKDRRSKKRIIGVMNSMINIGHGEENTPKGEYKKLSIMLAESLLNEDKTNEFFKRRKYKIDTPYEDRSPEMRNPYTGNGKDIWFRTPQGMIDFLDKVGFSKYVGNTQSKFDSHPSQLWKGPVENYENIRAYIRNMFDNIQGKITLKNTPFILKYRINDNNKYEYGVWVRRIYALDKTYQKYIQHPLEAHNGLGSLGGRDFEDVFYSILLSACDKNIQKNLQENQMWIQPFTEALSHISEQPDPEKYIKKTGKLNTLRKIWGEDFKNFKKLLKESGSKIADIEIQDPISNEKYYISLKDFLSQSSSVSNIRFISKIIEGDFQNKDAKYFANIFVSDSSTEDFLNLFKNFYLNPNEENTNKLNDFLKKNIDTDKIGMFIALILGGNYYYINSAHKQSIYVPPYYKLHIDNDVKFERNILNKYFRVKLYINGFKADLLCRTSNKDYIYPYRFFIQSDHIIDILKNL